MFDSIRRIFSSGPSARRVARVPEGERWYVIGDIHGRLDLFKELKAAIDADDATRPSAKTTIVLLGDLMDRGPDSAGVIALARRWGEERDVRYVSGNHEEMFLESFKDREVLRHFLKHGGRETVLSYGISLDDYRRMDLSQMKEAINQQVPMADREFLESFEDLIIVGDYVLVHAGLNPKHPVEEQKQSDLRWIRDRFLKHPEPFSHVVIHGHTIFEEVEDTEHRVGIDTGAFRTGRLTALMLEGDRRHIIQSVAGEDGTINIEKVD
ncbi:MAG: serine/threonine protein phosphatase [Altererythrobacter sp.]|nr:serine/threonine protein phosphatase [Sphingomonadaceae bacterium]MAW90531.1 serine/threonine protein phosphatase [Altererythrobacter sp.]MAW90654.1 serine/threonine protein phosphatase [Altererythrobacter sp.]MBK61410.1 serine/threonine protein phosphatase [Altererythrobacter sp.]|tara:strand:+ start:1005 stop:1805 length:801 start_codon:yes stop_codon:yes gene_type:complete